MVKKDNSQILIIIIIAIAVFIYAGQQGWFKGVTYTVNTETINQLENQPPGTCTADITPNVIIVGGLVTGTITADPSTFCEIYGTDGSGWMQIAEGTTGASGRLTFSENIHIVGTFEFRAICGTCVTNTETLVVNPVVTEDCIDSDGNDIFTFGHVDDLIAMVSYPDECYDSDSVIEYVCNPLPSAMMPQDCPTTHKCEGGRCIEKTGYDVGDIIDDSNGGSGSLPWEGVALTEGITIPWTTGGPYILGVRIHRSFTYVDPQSPDCQGTFPEVVEWTFWDSNGMAWQVYDVVPTTTVADVCPVTYHEDSPWKFEVRNSKVLCDIDYSWSLEVYICDVID